MPTIFSTTPVEVLAEALPPDGDNPIGRAARAILVKRLRAATPGHESRGGRTYRAIFFPKYQPDPNESQIEPTTGFKENFWSDFAVATLCQAMFHLTSEIRGQIRLDEATKSVNAANSSLRRKVSRWYAYMARVVDSKIKTALDAFRYEPERQQATDQYIAGLTSDSWINSKLTQEASQNWQNRDWELFHHCIKLVALGAKDDKIDSMMNILKSKLPVPSYLFAGEWQQHSKWFGSDIGWEDIRDAEGPMRETRSRPNPGGGRMARG
jgi:hypothetical protein